ncbi:MAG: formyltransferase family protein [Halobacteriaceae archaeon]
MENKSTSIAVLLDSYSVQEWQKQSLERLMSNENLNVKIDLVMINEQSTNPTHFSQLKSLIFGFSLFKLIILWGRLYTFIYSPPWYQETTPISELDIFNDAEKYFCKPKPTNGLGNKLPEDAIEALSRSDIGVRFGFGILKGEALTAPQYGVLSYHHGDLTKYRGRPAGFYEFLQDESTAGVTVQRLNETLDGGEIAAMTEVDISTAKSWGEVKLRLFDCSTDLLWQAIYRCKYEPEQVNNPRKTGKLYTKPSNKQMIVYLIKRYKNIR